MSMSIVIKGTPDRMEIINGRLLALQCEIGGCVSYVSDSEIHWQPDDLWKDNFDTIAAAFDSMVEFEVIDPTTDETSIDGEDSECLQQAEYWAIGFQSGMKNGLAFRNNSIPALQTALNNAELALKDEKDRADILADENHVLRQKVVAWEQAWAQYDKTADRHYGDTSLIDQIVLVVKPFPCKGPDCPEPWEGSDSVTTGGQK